MEKKDIYIIGGLALLIGGIYLFSSKEENTEEELVEEPASLPTVINKNLLLQKGSKGIEVQELQKILGLNADGIFGSQTEAALLNKKGVKQITLNNYSKTNNVVPTSLKVGDFVQSSKVLGTSAYKNETIGAKYTNTKKQIDTYFYTENIGKILAITADKMWCVILASQLLGSDKIIWVLTSEIELV